MTNQLRDPELALNPNKYAQTNGLTFEEEEAHLTGYQDFYVDPHRGHLRAVGAPLLEKEKAVDRLFTPRYMAKRSVLDLGGNNGFFCFKALKAGATNATVVDMDAECITNLHRVHSRFIDVPIRACHENVERWKEPADVVLAFALVHWIYSCTVRTLSLASIVEKLAQLTRDFLVVEWVDPSDPLVRDFHHTETGEGEQSEPYTFDHFLAELKSRFAAVELVGETSPTRRIYFATKHGIPDLSWSAPLLFPKETVLGSRLLWSTEGSEFWSRLYRVEDILYKQCTPELARRELAGAKALDQELELVEQHDSWWLLRRQLIQGESLDRLAMHRTFTREEILKIALSLIEFVVRLRSAGIIHRDLHPGNIIVDGNNALHLIDFGWAVIPGMADFSPASLGMVILQESRTPITIRPPEGSGDDLFAVGRVAAWLNRNHDDGVALVAEWLGHQDYQLRLSDVELAKQLIRKILEEDILSHSSVAGPPSLEKELLRAHARALVKDSDLSAKLARVEEEQATAVRGRDISIEQLRAQERQLRDALSAAELRASQADQQREEQQKLLDAQRALLAERECLLSGYRQEREPLAQGLAERNTQLSSLQRECEALARQLAERDEQLNTLRTSAGMRFIGLVQRIPFVLRVYGWARRLFVRHRSR